MNFINHNNTRMHTLECVQMFSAQNL